MRFNILTIRGLEYERYPDVSCAAVAAESDGVRDWNHVVGAKGAQRVRLNAPYGVPRSGATPIEERQSGVRYRGEIDLEKSRLFTRTVDLHDRSNLPSHHPRRIIQA
jgi:hypothetical protein